MCMAGLTKADTYEDKGRCYRSETRTVTRYNPSPTPPAWGCYRCASCSGSLTHRSASRCPMPTNRSSRHHGLKKRIIATDFSSMMLCFIITITCI